MIYIKKSIKFKHHCWKCDYHTNNKSKLFRHNNTIKHKKKVHTNSNIIVLPNIILIFVQSCDICNIEFTYESKNNLCWQCRINDIDVMIEYKKCKNTYAFCNNDNCLYCYNKSFLINPKHIYLDIEFGVDPRQIAKQDNNIFNFLCSCKHKFTCRLSYIYKNRWCPYCCYPPQKLCENDCNQC